MILGPGEGHAHYSARGSEMVFKATAELDGGDLSLMERTLPPGGRRPPPHRHTNCSEAYFVLDGVVSIIVEGQELAVEREGFVLVPRGTAHTFGNTSAEPARLLVIHTPAMDAYFAGLHNLWNRPDPPAPDEERALMARFGMTPAFPALSCAVRVAERPQRHTVMAWGIPQGHAVPSRASKTRSGSR
jgi:mannose-6-phosphate isomerase-like protein (cupin superfamily)